MGMQATVTSAVATAFRAAGDLVTSLPMEAPGTFDDLTEVETPGATGAIDVIQMTQVEAEKYFAGSNWRGLASDTQASDVNLMARAATATLVPQMGHKATWVGAVYTVHRIDSPNPALLFLGLRRPK